MGGMIAHLRVEGKSDILAVVQAGCLQAELTINMIVLRLTGSPSMICAAGLAAL
jgi:hypothetical protein